MLEHKLIVDLDNELIDVESALDEVDREAELTNE